MCEPLAVARQVYVCNTCSMDNSGDDTPADLAAHVPLKTMILKVLGLNHYFSRNQHAKLYRENGLLGPTICSVEKMSLVSSQNHLFTLSINCFKIKSIQIRIEET